MLCKVLVIRDSGLVRGVLSLFAASGFSDRTVPNDRFSKVLFNLTNDNFQDTCRAPISLVKMKKHKKFGKIISPFKIYVDETAKFTLSEPLNQFDCDVLIVCISEYRAGKWRGAPP